MLYANVDFEKPDVLYDSESFTVMDCRRDRTVALKDTKEHNLFLPNDWRWAASGVGMRKTADRLSKMPPLFKITVMMHDSGDHRTGARVHDGAKLYGLWEENPNRINAVLTNNISMPDRHIPLTPWMTLHRVIHCFQSNSSFTKDNESFKCFSNVLQELGLRANQEDLFGWDFSVELQNFLKLIMTTRCAREKEVSSDLDFLSELFAQHFMGGIKFLRTKDWEERDEMVLRPVHSPSVVYRSDDRHWNIIREMYKQPKKIDEMLGKLENAIATDMDNLTTSLIGKSARF